MNNTVGQYENLSLFEVMQMLVQHMEDEHEIATALANEIERRCLRGDNS